MPESTEIRKSTRETRGVPPIRFAMDTQEERSKSQPTTSQGHSTAPKGSSTPEAASGTPKQNEGSRQTQQQDASGLISAMQKEFQRQINTLQKFIITQTENTNNAMGQLRKEIQCVAQSRPQEPALPCE